MAPHPNNPKPLPYHRRTWPNSAGGMKQCHHGGSDRGGRLNLSRRQEAPVQTEHRSGCSSWSGTAGSPDDGRACSTANCALGNEHGPHTTPNTPHRTNLWITHTHTHTHPVISPFSRTTRVSRYQKGKINLDFTQARDSEWQWHQLGYMQVCTSLQTENHASTPPHSFLRPSCRPTNSVKALKANNKGAILKSRMLHLKLETVFSKKSEIRRYF